MKTKEFFSKWKQGIEEITPYQQVKISIIGAVLVLIGVIIGLVTMIVTKTWWLFIILLGSLLLVSLNFLGIIQKYWALKKINEMMKENDKEVKQDGQESTG